MCQIQLQMYLKNQSRVNVSVQESNEQNLFRADIKDQEIILADSLNTTRLSAHNMEKR